MRRIDSAQRGFTLIELMVVVIIISIGFTYGLLNIDLLVPNSRLNKAARDVGGMLVRLRGMAIFHGRSYYMEYDLDEHRYRVIRPTTLEEQDEGLDEYLETDWFELPKHININVIYFDSEKDGERNGHHRVEFTPTGEVMGHMVQLVSADITNEERNKYTLQLNAITGLVSYHRFEKKYAPVRDEFEM